MVRVFSQSLAKPCYFLHIPKTAGTSLISLLTSQFPAEQTCPAQLWSRLLAIPRRDLARYRLFVGHFYHYFLDYLGRPATAFTFLRDPVERALSHYEHILRDSHHYLHDKVKQQGSFLAFLHDPQTLPMVANFQTRALGVDLDPVKYHARLRESELRDRVLESQLESILPPEAEHERLLRRALARLDNLAFVGVVEHFGQSVEQLFDTLGWQLPEAIPCLNVSSNKIRRTAISSEERRVLLKHLQLDDALYERALVLRPGRKHRLVA
jgi:hypothetical protein